MTVVVSVRARHQTVGTDIAVDVGGAGAVNCCVPVREDLNGWGGELGELGKNLAYANLHSRRKVVLDPLPEKGAGRANPLGQVG